MVHMVDLHCMVRDSTHQSEPSSEAAADEGSHESDGESSPNPD